MSRAAILALTGLSGSLLADTTSGAVPDAGNPPAWMSPVPGRAGASKPVEAAATTRVGGDHSVRVERRGESYRCGPMAIEAPLPAGYPVPTPPGAIEIKHYPSVRRAEIAADRGTRSAFWPLFQHIKTRGIDMTSPVEMDYSDWSDSSEPRPGRWTMSFLYRTPDLGPVGDDGDIVIVDTAPVTVVSLGVRGRYGLDAVSRAIDELEAWLAGQDEWRKAGDPRALNYNGPSVPEADKWSEVHIPVVRN